MTGGALTITGLVLLALAGCARGVSPGVAHERAATAAAREQGHDVAIAPYHDALRQGAVAIVTGRVYEERRKPDAADTPLDGTELMLLPRSRTFLDTLETIKEHARDSLDRYRDAAPAVQRARVAYERALLERGGGDLPQALTVKPDGTFALPSLPAGDWVLVAAHTVFAKKAVAPTPGRARVGPSAGAPDRFIPQPKLMSHSYVTVWVRELTVKPGDMATVTLTDRNAWLTGVVEDTETPLFRASPPLAPGTGTPGAPGNTGSAGTGSLGPTLSPGR
jgi:hypothetical protein